MGRNELGIGGKVEWTGGRDVNAVGRDEKPAVVCMIVSGTTVRALVLGRFSQQILIELKDNAKEINKNISYYKGVMLWQFGPPMSALGLQDSS